MNICWVGQDIILKIQSRGYSMVKGRCWISELNIQYQADIIRERKRDSILMMILIIIVEYRIFSRSL